ncbi:DUF202 domain-containing protein [Paenarthrobacter ureafaciens]|jgi:uncharacterized membrane protein YidH (DUF202 family)|uniref:DUF202 domain-containing protein n=1 Tax=Paenarthrobacter ureafaciens TaxID=37931 RepID=UPI0008A6CF94|nr:DUF202 domain-containing protein [Paenarthrobacter ureafaciens]AOY74193.1 hypothetical protein ARZXY2_4694 [Arthrobacter sp. ZXY-2]MCX8455081.1 DUF202 domain-containing protein [Paenarthrobacter ureafaciens]MCY0974495.1 DUF202 domain-containing protein [Paenarthrobacter ureafaciens]
MTVLFDPGLQPERTGLAWQRTCLAFLAGSLVAMKVQPPIFGPWSLLLGAAGVLEALLLLFIVRRRYLRQHHTLTTSGGQPPLAADGFLPVALGSSTVAAGIVSLALILTIQH